MAIRNYSRRFFCNIKWCGLRSNPSCLYSSTENGLYLRVSRLASTIIVPASVCLPLCMFCSCVCMRGSRKFCQRGSNFDDDFLFFFFFFFFLLGENWWGGGSKYRYKWAIFGPPAKRRCCPNIECWLGFQGIRTSITKKPYIFHVFSGGWGVRTPCPSPLNPHMVCMC